MNADRSYRSVKARRVQNRSSRPRCLGNIGERRMTGPVKTSLASPHSGGATKRTERDRLGHATRYTGHMGIAVCVFRGTKAGHAARMVHGICASPHYNQRRKD